MAVPDRRTIDGRSHQPHHMTQMVRVRVKRTDNADEMWVCGCGVGIGVRVRASESVSVSVRVSECVGGVGVAVVDAMIGWATKRNTDAGGTAPSNPSSLVRVLLMLGWCLCMFVRGC